MKEKVLGKGYGGFDIVPLAKRVYECRECGNQTNTETNHRVDCYPNCKGSCHQIVGFPGTRIPLQTAHKFIKDIHGN